MSIAKALEDNGMSEVKAAFSRLAERNEAMRTLVLRILECRNKTCPACAHIGELIGEFITKEVKK